MKTLYTICCALFLTTSFAQNWRYNYYDLWSANSWQNNSQQVTVYLPDGRPDTLFANNFQGNAYSPASRSNFTYNGNNSLAEKTTVSLVSGNSQRSVFTYNSDGRLANRTELEMSEENSWTTTSQVIFGYNNDGTLSLQLDQVPDGNGSFVNLYKREYTYTPNAELSQLVFSVFTSGEWQPMERLIYGYTNGRLDAILSQNMDEEWENTRRQEYFYNTSDSLSTVVTYRWTEDENWEYLMRSVYTYNAEGVRNLEVISSWEDGWQNFSRRRFENDPVVLSLDEKQNEFDIYPNPFTDKLFIAGIGEMPVKIAITDLSGKVLLTAGNTADGEFVSAADLPAGVYNVTIASSQGTTSRRIVKL